MPDEHESAAAMWLADTTSQREVAILKKRFPSWREADVYQFAALIQIIDGMNFYGNEVLPEMEDEGPNDDPWDNDATGWKP